MLLYQKLPPSIARMGVSCRVDYLSAEPNSDSSPSIDPLLCPPLAWSPRSLGTVSWHDHFSSPSSTRVGSYTRGSGGYFEQIKEEWDDLGNPRSDVSMPSPHVVHSDYGGLHRMFSMLSFEPSGMISSTLVLWNEANWFILPTGGPVDFECRANKN